MKRCLLLLFFPFLFGTCARNDEVLPENRLVGRWSMTAQRDSTGKWNDFIPLVPVIIEFKKDGSFNYIDASGNPERGCCQPTRYVFTAPSPCPPGAYCLRTAGTIRFTEWVFCAHANCAVIQSWTTLNLNNTLLEIYAPPSVRSSTAFRHQRI